MLLQSRLTTAQQKNTEKMSEFQVYVDNGQSWPKLSPSELHQIQINPSVCNFDSVVVKSLAKRHLTIVNNFGSEILFELEINQEELNQTYPGSIIVPGIEFKLNNYFTLFSRSSHVLGRRKSPIML